MVTSSTPPAAPAIRERSTWGYAKPAAGIVPSKASTDALTSGSYLGLGVIPLEEVVVARAHPRGLISEAAAQFYGGGGVLPVASGFTPESGNKAASSTGYKAFEAQLRQVRMASDMQSSQVAHLTRLVQSMQQTVSSLLASDQLRARTSEELAASGNPIAEAFIARSGANNLTPEATLAAAETEGLLPDFLALIADKGLVEFSSLGPQLQELVGAEDAFVRSAASRALATISPGIARAILPGALLNEENRMVRAQMRAALDTAGN